MSINFGELEGESLNKAEYVGISH